MAPSAGRKSTTPAIRSPSLAADVRTKTLNDIFLVLNDNAVVTWSDYKEAGRLEALEHCAPSSQ
jgi:hypothetical protein